MSIREKRSLPEKNHENKKGIEREPKIVLLWNLERSSLNWTLVDWFDRKKLQYQREAKDVLIILSEHFRGIK